MGSPVEFLRPDPLKSWDVLRTVDAVTALATTNEPILDVGSLASAVPPALARLGYRRVCGIDLDERVRQMPRAGAVDYRVGDLTKTDWPDHHFAVITAISVIEHGVDQDRLFCELSRLLRPGGAFLFSTDYWPEKLDTSDTPLFGLPWTIFSAAEISALVERAANHGLVPVGEPRAVLRRVAQPPIDFAGRRYTFLSGGLIRE
jgi:SAM-dependent methyltransferase